MLINVLNKLFIYRVLVPKTLRTLIWKRFLKKQILNSYKDSEDKEVKKITRFLSNNKLEIFPYNYIFKYRDKNIDVFVDKEKKLNYVFLKERKKLYFKKNWSKKRIKKAFKQLLIEQDNDSPHRYLTNDFNVNKNSIVVDIGCAEGNFSLDIIDKVKHVYLFESDNAWIKPLKATFEKNKEKVTIVNKKLSNYDSDTTVNGNSFFKEKKINFLKIDVDGAEKEVVLGLSKIIENSKKMQIAFCTYHSKNDYKLYSNYFIKNGYKVDHSNGFTIFYWDKTIIYPYLRRGLIRANKPKLKIDY
tara:strand:- start:596 stop:1498 length:903 start_codon:yes stop_codon:yes gene_type:complete